MATEKGKKMGRPTTKAPGQQDVNIRFDKFLAGKARMIAKSQGKTIGGFLAELTRDRIDREYGLLMKQLLEKEGVNGG